MADRIVTAEKADRTPNWDKWRLIPNPTLWQCVALSLNIDPDKVHKEWLEISLVIRESRKFNDRIAVTVANAGNAGALRPTRYTMDNKCWEVSLREFAAWADRIGWEPPPELLAMADEYDPVRQKAPTNAEGKASGGRRSHNKRDTEARHREWQAHINKAAQASPGKSHAEYCRTVSRQTGVPFSTIRRKTKLGHS